MKRPVSQQIVRVALGQAALPVGALTFNKDGARENSSFAYHEAWLQSTDRFEISPDLQLVYGQQFRKAPSRDDSIFHFAFADTEPDGWGCRVIARDHARRRKSAQEKGLEVPRAGLTEMDYLLGVDDMSRIGALRFVDEAGNYLRSIEDGGRGTPPLLELGHLIGATRAVEMNRETAADLKYLRGRGTSLGGMRPKCTILDEDGQLAIGKFPSVNDDRNVTRGEVLALHLAAAAGITVAQSRIVMSEDIPVALVRRFDRVANGGRIPYLSAGSMLQASRQEEHAYTQIADCIIARCVDPKRDLEELWRRLVFNLLITNVDDHVQNHGFLHVEHGQWRLAPAFDINPFPDKDPELKLWLNEDYGPVDSIEAVMNEAPYFRLSADEAKRILNEVRNAVRDWKRVAKSAPVGMTDDDLDAFQPAFENEQVKVATALQ
ncbi:serine/threonine-protein kinase HipA [Paraburkholderia sp. BL6665CI2N2]|uniref:type II toxin-antitoxin system HipA family toxin n=1 Tax=Paraburkholderia sp. BL6665CI2N2 TaxID=1938806 RepID=UPI001064DB25|nr:type II toxin-antitoxin system HipA family toxin [Paraburkholderia sp. BL6665CI2N2]TDY22728.1 serine/threonine-protein kinase HipA [Paraburkholderia sp. BL6665CI2N2]